jgi:hypothetical protein
MNYSGFQASGHIIIIIIVIIIIIIIITPAHFVIGP